MKRGESVAVIYLSLLVCLALGQGTEGRGIHSATLVAHHTHTHLHHSNIHTQEYKITRNFHHVVLHSSGGSHTVSTTVTGSDLLNLEGPPSLLNAPHPLPSLRCWSP